MRLKDFDFRLKSPWLSLTFRDHHVSDILWAAIFIVLIGCYSAMMVMGGIELYAHLIKALKLNDILALLAICGGALACFAFWIIATKSMLGMVIEMFFYNASNVIRLKNWWYCFAGTDVRIKNRLDEDEIDMPEWRYHYDGYYTLTFLFKKDAILYKLKY